MVYLETYIGQQMSQIVGDPMVLGVLVLAFFGIISFLYPTNFAGKLVIALPAMFLTLQFIPYFLVVMVLFTGYMLYLLFQRVQNR